MLLLYGLALGLFLGVWLGKRHSTITLQVQRAPYEEAVEEAISDEELIAEATELSQRAASPYLRH